MVDDAIVADKLRLVNEYTDDLREIRHGLSKEEYVEDVIVQRAVERTFVNLIQCCIDLAQHIRASEVSTPADTAKQEIQALGDVGVITPAVQERMEDAVGFRNVLVHRYSTIDHDSVYEVLQEDLHWFEQFQQEVALWLQENG